MVFIMNKQDWKAELKAKLLKVCKYYKGEQQCPYKATEDNTRFMLWHGEHAFVASMEDTNSTEIVHQCVEYQFYVGKQLPAEGYELQRNAVLFRMYCKTNYSAALAVPGFVKLMQEYYT